MRHLFSLYCAVFFFGASLSASEGQMEDSFRRGIGPNAVNVRTNAAYLIAGNWNLAVDLPLAEAVTVGPMFLMSTLTNNFDERSNGAVSDKKTKLQTYGLGVQMNIRLGGDPGAHFLVNPFLFLAPGSASYRENGVDYRGKILGFAAGLLFAYRFYIFKGLNCRFGAGASYMAPKNVDVTSVTGQTKNVGVPSLSMSGWMPQIEASLGYQF